MNAKSPGSEGAAFHMRAVAAERNALRRISEWMDANPTVRLDNSIDPRGDAGEVQLAVLVATSEAPESLPLYKKMVLRQPDLLTKEFHAERATMWAPARRGRTLAQDIEGEMSSMNSRAPGYDILKEKLNPGSAAEKVSAIVNKRPGVGPDVERKITSYITGMGRRKTRRRGRKGTRKTK